MASVVGVRVASGMDVDADVGVDTDGIAVRLEGEGLSASAPTEQPTSETVLATRTRSIRYAEAPRADTPFFCFTMISQSNTSGIAVKGSLSAIIHNSAGATMATLDRLW